MNKKLKLILLPVSLIISIEFIFHIRDILFSRLRN